MIYNSAMKEATEGLRALDGPFKFDNLDPKLIENGFLCCTRFIRRQNLDPETGIWKKIRPIDDH